MSTITQLFETVLVVTGTVFLIGLSLAALVGMMYIVLLVLEDIE